MAPKKIEQTALELALKNVKYQEEVIETLTKQVVELTKECENLREQVRVVTSKEIVVTDVPKKKNIIKRVVA